MLHEKEISSWFNQQESAQIHPNFQDPDFTNKNKI